MINTIIKKKILLLISFLLVAELFYAQNKYGLVGKWKYYDVYTKNDSSRLKSLNLLFREDGTYKSVIYEQEDKGVWKYNSTDKYITLHSNLNNDKSIYVFSLDPISEPDLIGLRIDDMYIFLRRSVLTKEDEKEELFQESTSFKVTIEQIAQKWYIYKQEWDSISVEQNQIASKLLKGAFYDFTEEGAYTYKAFGLNEEGRWEFRNNNSSIEMKIGESKSRICEILKVSEDELVLGLESGCIWYFSIETQD